MVNVAQSVEGLVDVPINSGGESFIYKVDRGTCPNAGVGVFTDIALGPDISNASRLQEVSIEVAHGLSHSILKLSPVPVLVGGDLICPLSTDERVGPSVNPTAMKDLAAFIQSNNLIDLPLGERSSRGGEAGRCVKLAD
ncbi:hypothetical protein V6N13_061263 [Hibiscus sabdariffa]